MASQRNFYGIYAWSQQDGGTWPYRVLTHGRTIHGSQYLQGTTAGVAHQLLWAAQRCRDCLQRAARPAPYRCNRAGGAGLGAWGFRRRDALLRNQS